MSVTFMAKSAPDTPGAEISANKRKTVIRVDMDGDLILLLCANMI